MNISNEGLMYKAAAGVIFVIIAALVVLIAVSTARGSADTGEIDDGTAVLTEKKDTETTVSDSTESASDTADVTETQAMPSDTAPDTGSSVPADTTPTAFIPVNAPEANSTEAWDNFLSEYTNTVLQPTEDAGPDYIEKMVFLGDSTTYGLRAYKMLPGGRDTTQVWTPTSGTLTLSQVSFAKIVYPETGAEITINEAVTAKKPEYLVITLGVNGISFMDEEYFKSEYKKMLEGIIEASPDTKIICQSIFPVARTYAHLGSINNDKIRAANYWIVEIASEVGVKFIDTYSVLCDSEGWLPESYHNGDGMHLNSTSFTIELENLRTHAYIEE